MKNTDTLKLLIIPFILWACNNSLYDEDPIKEDESPEMPICIIENPIEEKSYCSHIIEDTCTNIKSFTGWDSTSILKSNCNTLNYINIWNNCPDFLISNDEEKAIQDYCNTDWYYRH